MDNKKTDSKEIRKKNVSDGNAKHLRRINEITISVSLKPEEVIKEYFNSSMRVVYEFLGGKK